METTQTERRRRTDEGRLREAAELALRIMFSEQELSHGPLMPDGEAVRDAAAEGGSRLDEACATLAGVWRACAPRSMFPYLEGVPRTDPERTCTVLRNVALGVAGDGWWDRIAPAVAMDALAGRRRAGPRLASAARELALLRAENAVGAGLLAGLACDFAASGSKVLAEAALPVLEAHSGDPGPLLAIAAAMPGMSKQLAGQVHVRMRRRGARCPVARAAMRSSLLSPHEAIQKAAAAWLAATYEEGDATDAFCLMAFHSDAALAARIARAAGTDRVEAALSRSLHAIREGVCPEPLARLAAMAVPSREDAATAFALRFSAAAKLSGPARAVQQAQLVDALAGPSADLPVALWNALIGLVSPLAPGFLRNSLAALAEGKPRSPAAARIAGGLLRLPACLQAGPAARPSASGWPAAARAAAVIGATCEARRADVMATAVAPDLAPEARAFLWQEIIRHMADPVTQGAMVHAIRSEPESEGEFDPVVSALVASEPMGWTAQFAAAVILIADSGPGSRRSLAAARALMGRARGNVLIPADRGTAARPATARKAAGAGAEGALRLA